MIVCIRADASTTIGTGHIARCMALAKKLRASGNTVFFVCRSLSGNMVHIIREEGFDAFLITTDNHRSDADATKQMIKRHYQFVDLLIVDHYALDVEWESVMKSCSKKILVIDDLANRRHQCDIILDQNHMAQPDRYRSLVPASCIQLLGPKYALLRDEFKEIRRTYTRKSTRVNHVLVFYGGSDPTSETLKTLAAIKNLQKYYSFHFSVVVGASNKNKEEISQQSKMMRGDFYCQTNDMASLIRDSDIALCAGGTFTWERLCLGLPGLITTVADNQISVAVQTSQLDIDTYLGHYDKVSVPKMINAFEQVLRTPELHHERIQRAMSIVDGKGTDRVVDVVTRSVDRV